MLKIADMIDCDASQNVNVGSKKRKDGVSEQRSESLEVDQAFTGEKGT